MLRHFFASVRKLRDGPARPYLQAFAKELYQTGYARIAACRHLRAAAHLMHWTRRKGLSPTSLNDTWVESFRHHLPQRHCLGYGRRSPAEPLRGARQFLAYLHRAGVVPASAAEGRSPRVPVLLDAFRQWMREQRGASPRTLDTYTFFIRDFLKTVGQQPRRYTAHRLRQFVLEGSRRWGRARARTTVTALRVFIRFLIATVVLQNFCLVDASQARHDGVQERQNQVGGAVVGIALRSADMLLEEPTQPEFVAKTLQ